MEFILLLANCRQEKRNGILHTLTLTIRRKVSRRDSRIQVPCTIRRFVTTIFILFFFFFSLLVDPLRIVYVILSSVVYRGCTLRICQRQIFVISRKKLANSLKNKNKKKKWKLWSFFVIPCSLELLKENKKKIIIIKKTHWKSSPIANSTNSSSLIIETK